MAVYPIFAVRTLLLLVLPVFLAAVILSAAGNRGTSVFKKQGVAWVVTGVMILCAIGIGQAKANASITPEPGMLDDSLDTSYCTQFIDDRAGVLNSSAEKQLALYLANWDVRYHSVVAFVSVNSVSGTAEDYAGDAFADLGLEEGDALLLVVGSDDVYQFVWGDAFDSIMTDDATDQLMDALSSGSWQNGVPRFYATLNSVYVANFGLGDGGTQSAPNPAPAQSSHRASAAPALFTLVVFVVILVLLLSAIDRGRYHAYRRQYYGVVNPPVVFRPIFFWHGPRSVWYRRNWRRPPPPPPAGPRAPSGFGGTPPRPPSGGSRPSSGFGGTPPRTPSGGSRPSGGFGGSRGSRRPGGSRGSSRPGGSFGGSRSSGPRSSGGSRPSGGFGGSRGGGGRSGGSFGGRR